VIRTKTLNSQLIDENRNGTQKENPSIEVPVPSQQMERLCIWVLVVSVLLLATILLY